MKYTIGVIGTGTAGKGIVEAVVKTEDRVFFKSRTERVLEKAMEIISKRLSKDMGREELEITLSRITVTTQYESLYRANLIIEAVIEDLQIKNKIFQKLDTICNSSTILASNTSSLSISKIIEGLKHPERAVGIHFFNPIPKMKLVEIVKTKETSDSTLKKAHEFAARFNKIAVDVKDTTGFIVNRLLFIAINEACCMLDQGVASIEDIDRAMKMGANHPMGPFELADLIGLDICLEIIENLNASFGGNKFEPTDRLKTLVKEGDCGRKTGRGFYQYSRY